jgi:ABC-2 type transport system ATP-binding protein
MSVAAPPLLRVRDACKSYGAVHALRGVSFDVAAGEVLALLGPNGAGKSTLIRSLTTLQRLDAGSAEIAGADVGTDPAGARRAFGYAGQESALDKLLTGAEMLRFQAGLAHLPRAESAARSQELLHRFGLAEAAGRAVETYSGGMKRRLDLASALVHRPDVLFLDEPTTGLDPASRLTVWDEVRRINEQGTTVFLTTQYLEEADQLCDRLAIIDDGTIVREGTPGQLKADLKQRLGLTAEPTLDDVFLDATGRTRDRIEGAVQEVGA